MSELEKFLTDPAFDFEVVEPENGTIRKVIDRFENAKVPGVNGICSEAFAAGRRGWPVFPLHSIVKNKCTCGMIDCDNAGKHPRQKGGFHNATTDEEVIRKRFGNGPYVNIGLRTGKESGLILLDVDPDKGGADSLSELESLHVQLPETVTVATGGGGRHLYFKHPGNEIKCSAGTLAPGLDIRADGGYAILPSSRHISGKRYTWEISPDDVAVAEMPDWLEILTRQPSGTNGRLQGNTATVGDTIPIGQRNLTLSRLAGTMRRPGMAENEILAALLEANKRCEPPLSEREVGSIASSVAKYSPGEKVEPASNNRAQKLNAPTIARQLSKDTPFLYTGQRLRRYHDGVFQKDGDRFVKQTLQTVLGEQYTKAHSDEVVAYLEVANDIDHEDLKPHPNLINLKNGVFNWEAGRLVKHSPDYRFISQIPVEYDEKATCPAIDKFLVSTLPSDCIEIIEELFGYCLIRDNRFQRAFMFVGDGANGKGTAIDLLEAFLGIENVSKVPLQEIDDHRFKRAELFGRLANVFADLDRRALRGTSYFKTIVAGDSIDAERKFKSTFFFRPYAKLIFSANEVPNSPDNSHAFYRRWCIIPFRNKFEGKDADVQLLAKLTTQEELSGLLNRALQGLIRLIDNNGFTEPQSVLEAKSDYRKASDSAYAFLSEKVVEGPDKYVKKAAIYATYASWCEDSGIRPPSRQRFNVRLQEMYNIRPENKKGVGKIWPGIGLIDEDHNE